MLTVRLVKYGPHSTNEPTRTEMYSVREANAIHVRREADGRQVLQLGDAPGETQDVTVGMDRTDCSYDIAYVMNSTGKTVDKIQ